MRIVTRPMSLAAVLARPSLRMLDLTAEGFNGFILRFRTSFVPAAIHSPDLRKYPDLFQWKPGLEVLPALSDPFA